MTVLDRPAPSPSPALGAPRKVDAPSRVAAGAWLDAAAILVGVGAAAAPVGAYFETSSWLLLGLAIVAGIALAATIARVVAVRRWIAVLVSLAATLVLVTAALTPGEGFLILLPSPDSIGALRERLVLGGADLAAGAAPMAETGSTIVALAAAVVLIGLVATVLVVLGLPALVGPVLLVLWIIPGTVNGADADLLAFFIVGASWLVLLTGRQRVGSGPAGATIHAAGRRLGPPALVTGALALVIAVVAAPLAPRTEPLTGLGSVSGFFDATGIDQTVALGEQLRGGSSAVMLRYVADDPQYLRVLTLTDFTGNRWIADEPRRLDSAPPDLVVPGPGETPVDTVVTIDGLRTRSLPIPIDTAAVAGLPPGWRWNAGLATVSSESDDTAELVYTATTLRSVPDRAALAVAAPWADPTNDAPELELPDRVPDLIVETAAEVTAAAVDDYERALALQEWLRDGGGFVYSVNAPVREGFDGSGLEALEGFFEVREGYCIHFASAMAVMARTLDIPSRLSIGFAPGDATTVEDGLTEWAVTGEDLHAWPELWFEGIGWVPFEPTPGLGLAAADPIVDAMPDDDDDVIAPTTAPTTAPTVAPDEELPDGAAAPGVGAGVGGAGGVAAILALVLLVLLVPAIIRALLRRVRLGSGASPESRWREIVDTATDLGVVIPAGATPRAAAGILDAVMRERDAGVVGADHAALLALRDGVERARYGPPAAAVSAPAAAHRVLAAIRGASPTGARMLAVLAPRSLLRAARSGVRDITSRYAGAS